jgi:hypothetical protein
LFSLHSVFWVSSIELCCNLQILSLCLVQNLFHSVSFFISRISTFFLSTSCLYLYTFDISFQFIVFK